MGVRVVHGQSPPGETLRPLPMCRVKAPTCFHCCPRHGMRKPCHDRSRRPRGFLPGLFREFFPHTASAENDPADREASEVWNPMCLARNRTFVRWWRKTSSDSRLRRVQNEGGPPHSGERNFFPTAPERFPKDTGAGKESIFLRRMYDGLPWQELFRFFPASPQGARPGRILPEQEVCRPGRAARNPCAQESQETERGSLPVSAFSSLNRERTLPERFSQSQHLRSLTERILFGKR